MATQHTLTTEVDHLEIENLKFSNILHYFRSFFFTKKPPFHDPMYHVGFIRQLFNLRLKYSTLIFADKRLKKTSC